MQLILRRRRRNTSLTALLWMANIFNFPAKNWMSLFWVQCMSNIWHKDLSSNIFFLCTVETQSKHSKYNSIFTSNIHFWIINFFLFPISIYTYLFTSHIHFWTINFFLYLPGKQQQLAAVAGSHHYGVSGEIIGLRGSSQARPKSSPSAGAINLLEEISFPLLTC